MWKITLIVMLLVVSSAPLASASPTYLRVDEVTMWLEGYNATLELKYELNFLAKTYVLLFGAKTIEPEIRKFLPFEEIKILKLNDKRALVRVINITRSVDEKSDRIYYLYQPYYFSYPIKRIVIVYPDGTRLELFNRDSTPPKIATIYK
ncbi:hypothetical protein DRN72_01850 [Methanosarcinales archaeon]|nr:MAG: hypothetical protein DRN72_01850 [Methanosarcinales archaeon]